MKKNQNKFYKHALWLKLTVPSYFNYWFFQKEIAIMCHFSETGSDKLGSFDMWNTKCPKYTSALKHFCQNLQVVHNLLLKLCNQLQWCIFLRNWMGNFILLQMILQLSIKRKNFQNLNEVSICHIRLAKTLRGVLHPLYILFIQFLHSLTY